MSPEIALAIQTLKIFDADDNMDIEYVKSCPLYQLLEMIHQYDREVFYFLLYNVCQRVIPGWEFNINNKILRPALFAVRNFVLRPAPKETLLEFNVEIKSPLFDCSWSDTSGAAGTLFNSIQSILNDSPLFATYAVSDADIANTSNFDQWFTEIALPAAFNKQVCNLEQTAQYAHDVYRPFYEDLFKEIEGMNNR